MDDKGPNFVLIRLDLIPTIADIKHMRRMAGGWTEGPAIQVCGGFWKQRLSAFEMTFIAAAFKTKPTRPAPIPEAEVAPTIQGDWFSRRCCDGQP
jgi:hypothetical protein